MFPRVFVRAGFVHEIRDIMYTIGSIHLEKFSKRSSLHSSKYENEWYIFKKYLEDLGGSWKIWSLNRKSILHREYSKEGSKL